MVWDDDDDPPDEPEDDADDATVPCPHCREPVYEDAERCPSCGRYLSAEDAPPSRPPAWIVVGALSALAALLWWVFRL